VRVCLQCACVCEVSDTIDGKWLQWKSLSAECPTFLVVVAPPPSRDPSPWPRRHRSRRRSVPRHPATKHRNTPPRHAKHFHSNRLSFPPFCVQRRPTSSAATASLYAAPIYIYNIYNIHIIYHHPYTRPSHLAY